MAPAPLHVLPLVPKWHPSHHVIWRCRAPKKSKIPGDMAATATCIKGSDQDIRGGLLRHEITVKFPQIFIQV